LPQTLEFNVVTVMHFKLSMIEERRYSEYSKIRT